jgi:hypothetical protein
MHGIMEVMNDHIKECFDTSKKWSLGNLHCNCRVYLMVLLGVISPVFNYLQLNYESYLPLENNKFNSSDN